LYRWQVAFCVASRIVITERVYGIKINVEREMPFERYFTFEACGFDLASHPFVITVRQGAIVQATFNNLAVCAAQ
jgi:hypothetical protein